MSDSPQHKAWGALETGPGTEDLELGGLIRDAIEAVNSLCDVGGPDAIPQGGYERNFRGQLAILRALLGMKRSVLAPVFDYRAPLGYAFASVEREFAMDPGMGAEVLEGLADLGLLKRELHANVHVCPRCQHFHVNYRETCVGCNSMEIDIERLIHHFHCAYIGLESEYQHGIDLVCPRCRKRLFQLGQDFESPSDTYVCHDCNRIFEDPLMDAVCVYCSHGFLAKDTEMAKVFRYAPTPLTVRAVELNRLTGLDVNEIMFDTNVRLATRDFLDIEVERETHRVRRYGGSFSCVILSFVADERAYPIFREWRADTIHELGRMLTQTLRPLDLVARLGNDRIGLLLPETDAEGVHVVEERMLNLLQEAALSTRDGRSLFPDWTDATWTGVQASKEQAMAFFDRVEEVR